MTGAEPDYDRYKRLLAEAVDEPKRLALIDLLIKERAKERLEAAAIAKVLGTKAA
jgi:hypothetical protein